VSFQVRSKLDRRCYRLPSSRRLAVGLLNVYTNKFYFMGFKSVSRVHTLLEERRCTVASEPLTTFEVQYPDPRERREIQQLQPAAYALGVPAEMLRGGQATEVALAFAQHRLGTHGVLRALFGNDAW